MALGYHDIERIALQYVLEDEVWPEFVNWVREYAKTQDAMDWAEMQDPDQQDLRLAYIAHHGTPMIAVENPPGSLMDAKDYKILKEDSESQWPGS